MRRPSVDLAFIRIVFVVVMGVAAAFLQPFGLNRPLSAAVGVFIGLAILVFEMRLRAVSLKRLIGAVIGSILGIFGAYLFSLVIRESIAPGNTQHFLELLVMLLMAYVG